MIEIVCEAQSPNAPHDSVPVTPAKPDMFVSASRNACRSIFKVPSDSTTATHSMAVNSITVAS